MKHASILAIVLCLLVSCNRNTIKTNKNCGREPDLVGQTVRFNLMNKSMTSTFNIIKYEDDGTKKESVISSGINENMLQFFIKYCLTWRVLIPIRRTSLASQRLAGGRLSERLPV